MLAWAHRTGRINLIGAVIDESTQPNCTLSLHAFLKKRTGFFGIPLGIPLTSYDPGGAPAYQATMLARLANYVDQSFVYPDAVAVYRQLLVDNDEVEIVSTGYCNNLSELLNSPADGISPLTGLELITAKVARIWVASGQFPSGSDNNFTRNAGARAAAVNVCTSWPTPVIFCGNEVGGTVVTGGNLIGQQTTDVFAQALLDYATPTGRPGWGQMVCLAMIADNIAEAGFTSVAGTITVNPATGTNTFAAGAGSHSYLVKSLTDAEYQTRINTILVSSNWNTYDPFV